MNNIFIKAEKEQTINLSQISFRTKYRIHKQINSSELSIEILFSKHKSQPFSNCEELKAITIRVHSKYFNEYQMNEP